ncbi:MAG: diaminopimelate dehydrogenase [Clostridia bacterium]|nr:diaminopimelate dehydrogenase [Clostridia bacterium]
MRLAIVGYGNLGKSLEKTIIHNDNIQLTAIYSRRTLDNKMYRPLQSITQHVDFDVVLNALGSYDDARQYAPLLAKFDTVDSFDTHASIAEYKEQLNKLNGDRIAIVGAGWDPGILSLIRGTFSLGNTPVTVWGNGISQGHSNAVRNIDGVIDAVQFTVPKNNYKTIIQNGEHNSANLHDRLCYVACVEEDKDNVKRQIKDMPNYFVDYNTTVKFVTPAEVRQLKQDTSHCGQVFCSGNGYVASACLKLDCNTDLTAQVMLMYAQAVAKLKQYNYHGALDVFDIPLKYIAGSNLV